MLRGGRDKELLRTECVVGTGGFGSGLGVAVQFPDVVVALLTSRMPLLLSSIMIRFAVATLSLTLCPLTFYTPLSLFSCLSGVSATSWEERKREARKCSLMVFFIRLTLLLLVFEQGSSSGSDGSSAAVLP